MGFVTGDLLTLRREDGELGFAFLVKPLAVHEAVLARADLGGDLRTDIGVGGLDLLDVPLRRAVLGLEQEVERLDHRGLAHLVGPADDGHTAFGEVDLAVGDSPIVGQNQPMQSHAAPLRCAASLSNSASAPWASSAASSPDRAVFTSSATAEAANPPMPRSANSPSAGTTAISQWLSHNPIQANNREYLSRQASSAARSVTVRVPVRTNCTTVRSLSAIRSRFMSRSAMSRLLSTPRRSVVNRHRPTRRASTETWPAASSSRSTTSTWPGSDSM